jgi:hypothetical protein
MRSKYTDKIRSRIYNKMIKKMYNSIEKTNNFVDKTSIVSGVLIGIRDEIGLIINKNNERR